MDGKDILSIAVAAVVLMIATASVVSLFVAAKF